MASRDPRVDAYIAKSAEFARPILEHLREVVHAACPDAEETIKWGFPHFQYQGLLCHMAAFKGHCAFGFWKGALVFGEGVAADTAMGQFGRITGIADLPSKKVLGGYIKKAMALNEDGVKSPSRSKPKVPRPDPIIPDELAAALGENPAARARFDQLSPGHRREYIEWIDEAKTAPTRVRRIETTIQWVSEGKSRNWKYEKC